MDAESPHDAHVHDYERHCFMRSEEFAAWRQEAQARRQAYETDRQDHQATQRPIKAKPHRLPGQAEKIRVLHGAIRQRKRVAVQQRGRGSTAAAEREERQAAVFESILRDVQKSGTTN